MKSAATSTHGARDLSQGSNLSAAAHHLARIPILYVILSVLLVISIVPMYFYSAQVEAINRDRLKTNEMLLQNTVTRSLADDLSQHEHSLRMMLANLSSAIQVASGGDIGSKNIEAPELRALLENFVSSSDEVAYATLLNSDAKGISAGRIAPDAFLQRELQHAYDAARDGRAYNGQALQVGNGNSARTVVLVSSPVSYGGRFLGMVGAVVDLQFLIRRLQEVSGGGLIPYVVDSQGRLVAAGTPQYVTGQDMKSLEIVRNFVDEGNKAQLAATKEFAVPEGKGNVEMLGTYSPVTALDWAVVVQKPQREAYRGVYEMQRTARLLARAGGAPKHRREYFRGPQNYQSAADSHAVQPRPGTRRFFAARPSCQPHRNRRIGGDLQHHVTGTGTVRRRSEAGGGRKPRAVSGLDPDAGGRG